MHIKRVLTVESIKSFYTQNMLKTIYNSPQYKNYELIDHCYFLKGHQKRIKASLLFNIINNKIESINPDAILIHSGDSFNDNIDNFIEIIPLLKSKYPSILFGIQDRQNVSNNFIKLLDNNNCIKKLEYDIFKER